MPSGEEASEKIMDEAVVYEPSLNEPKDEDVEIQATEPICHEPERPTVSARPSRAGPMEVEEVPHGMQPIIYAEMEVSPPEVTSTYRRLRSSSRLPQLEGGPSLSDEP